MSALCGSTTSRPAWLRERRPSSTSLGIDETRRGKAKYEVCADTGKRRWVDRFDTGLVDITRDAGPDAPPNPRRTAHAQLIVDRFHLVKRANQMVEAVRRRTTWQSRGRRRRNADPEWINRRRLLRAAERLTNIQRAGLVAALDTADPNGDIFAAWIAKELLRDVPAATAAGGMRYDISAALHRFYAFCAATTVPEIHNLAETIETWQAPMILAITGGSTN